MVQIYSARNSEFKHREGYEARYVADILLRREVQSAGFIFVRITKGNRTDPHKHSSLEEVFAILKDTSMWVDDIRYELEKGDIVLIEPGEIHWFEAPKRTDVVLIAVKFPNLKTDKTTPQE